MYAAKPDLSQMLAALTDEYRAAAESYINYLIQVQKSKTQTTLRQIQGMFSENKGWSSEEEMLKDMADFRRQRLALLRS